LNFFILHVILVSGIVQDFCWDEGMSAARRAWPGIEIPDAELTAYVCDRIAGESSLAPERFADLFIACACARGDGRAIAALEARYFVALPAQLRRTSNSDDAIADAMQDLRTKLFAQHRIHDYTGRGSLEGWLKVAAARTLLHFLEKHQREKPVEDAGIEDALLSRVNPELEFVKAQYRADFHAAFREALQTLSPDDRTMLRLHVIDGLNIAEIGALRKVHRATVARWIADTRARILAETRAQLARRLKVAPDELDSVLGLMTSQLGQSLHRFLADT
jgi:RNA polymerase sigma-70 factor, ECF subfamily